MPKPLLLPTLLLLAALGTASATHATTLCQAASGATYCSNQVPGSADANGYHSLPSWTNLNKQLTQIAVNDNQVWGVDAAGVLWLLPNFGAGTTWTQVTPGVAQMSATHNLVCVVSTNSHLYCSGSAGGAAGIKWVDAGATNFKQIALSAGNQLWAVDVGGNLYQVKDYTNVSATAVLVAAGVQQVATDGRGVLCVNSSTNALYCTNRPNPPVTVNGPYHSLSWVATGANLQNIAVADGEVVGVDGSGNVWLLPDFTNAGGGYKIAYGGVGDKMAAASLPSAFTSTTFARDEVAVLLFMGQSNAVGINAMPSRYIAPTSPNVWGVTNAGWNFLPGNVEGTTPFSSSISTINAVQWSSWKVVSGGADMNLGFTSTTGGGGNAANFAAYQWQSLIDAGAKLPDLYIVHIGWPSQGVDVQDTYSGSVPWTAHGVNLWQPLLTNTQIPSYALAPFARRIVTESLVNLLASGKKPRLIGLQWNQWEAEAGNSNPISITDAPANYNALFGAFFTAVGTHFPVQIVKPLSLAYGAANLSAMQTVFGNLVAGDPADFSIVDASTASATVFSGGLQGGGDGSVHYNLDTHQWFAGQAIGACLVSAKCGPRITTVPAP